MLHILVSILCIFSAASSAALAIFSILPYISERGRKQRAAKLLLWATALALVCNFMLCFWLAPPTSLLRFFLYVPAVIAFLLFALPGMILFYLNNWRRMAQVMFTATALALINAVLAYYFLLARVTEICSLAIPTLHVLS